jgi:hypothetical protein
MTSVHETWSDLASVGADVDHGVMELQRMMCPDCKRHILRSFSIPIITDAAGARYNGAPSMALLYPKAALRPPPPQEVPNPFAQDYREACLVLADSPKASAALSRRCLQLILRDKGGVKHSDLSHEIEEAMPLLPLYLSGAIDAVRTVGNFAAHPIKSASTGEVVDVELGEAEWLLDTLEGLFGFYFVEPAALQKKRDELNAKLGDAGKPRLKQPPEPAE